jgi:Uma2 family endonuclease
LRRTTTAPDDTMADVIERLGNIPPERILAHPAPGTATEEDAIARLEAANKKLVELVDGVLVEKAMGSRESLLASWIVRLLWNYLEANDLGLAFGGDGPLRLRQGLLRLPDVSFVSWEQMPEGLPDEIVLTAYPDLAVEVVSKSNTKAEIERKLRDYLLAGTQLVWVIYPRTQSAEVYTAPDHVKRVGKKGTLDGGDLLPGFTVSLKELFDRPRRRPRKSS